MTKRREIERIDVLQSHYDFGARRMKPFVSHAATMASFGNMDLQNLAVSAYLQGVWDGAETILGRRPPLVDVEDR